MATMESSDRARLRLAIAETEVVATVLVTFSLVLIYVAAPGVMFPDPHSEVRMTIAFGLATIGFAWMVRIYRDAIRT